MTGSTGTRFEQELRWLLDDEAPAVVPLALREAVASVPYRPRRRRLPFAWSWRPRAALAATAAIALVVAVGAGATWLGSLPGVGEPVATPSPSPSPAFVHLDLAYRVVPDDGRPPTDAEVRAVADVLIRRASGLLDSPSVGLAVPGDTIDVSPITLPAGDPSAVDTIRAILGTTGHVAFVPIPDGLTPEPVVGERLDLDRFPPLFADAVASAIRVDDAGAGAGVDITLKPEAGATFAAYTRDHVGEWFAIVIDGAIVALPRIGGAIENGELVVTLRTTDGSAAETATWLAAVLDSGPLPFPIQETAVISP